jgi:predicted membrane protein
MIGHPCFMSGYLYFVFDLQEVTFCGRWQLYMWFCIQVFNLCRILVRNLVFIYNKMTVAFVFIAFYIIKNNFLRKNKSSTIAVPKYEGFPITNGKEPNCDSFLGVNPLLLALTFYLFNTRIVE